MLVEGPSIKLLETELHMFVNQKVKAASGNAKFEKQILLKQRINEIFSFGKKIIIQLDTHAVVTHFLMYGTYRVDTPRPEMAPRFSLVTSKHSLFFYNCSTKCYETSDFKKTVAFEYDILSPDWDIKKVTKAIKAHKNSTIDDVLLDQDIFAGVGNIIKNEVLFLSKTSPYKKVSQLSAKKINDIALCARSFSQKFLELRKIFKLKENLTVYRKKLCPTCNSPITKAKTGKRNRWSFMCVKCQK